MADKNPPPRTSQPICTCGKCVGGYFSARMKDRLEAEADFLQFAALDLAADLETGEVLAPEGLITEQYINSDTSLHYIPTTLYEKMTPAFVHGYIIVLQAALHILLEEFDTGVACVPTVDAVVARVNEILKGEVDPSTSSSSKSAAAAAAAKAKSDAEDESDVPTSADIAVLKVYLDAGGKVEYALDAITGSASEKSPVGDLYRRHQHVRDEDADFAKEIGGLPACANDLAFKAVRSKLGLSEDDAGPHWIFLSDDEGDSGDEEEALYEGSERKES